MLSCSDSRWICQVRCLACHRIRRRRRGESWHPRLVVVAFEQTKTHLRLTSCQQQQQRLLRLKSTEAKVAWKVLEPAASCHSSIRESVAVKTMAKICPFPDLDDGRTELISRSSMYRVAVSASPLSLHFFTTKHHSSALLSRHHRLEQAILLSEHSADITAPSHRFMSHSLQESNNTDFDIQQITNSTRLTSAQHDDYDAEDFPPITEQLFSLDTDEVNSAISTEDIGPSTSKRKGKARQERNRNQAADEEYDSDSSEEVRLHSPIANLPLEILSRILAHLDPTTLLHCTAVSRTFAGVAKDDATWRLAFALAFHLEGTGTTPILRRVDAISWKAEYTRRIELLR